MAERGADGLLAGIDVVDAEVLAGPRPDLRIPTAVRVFRDVARQHRHAFEGA